MYLLFIHIISFFNNFFQEPSLIISSLPEVFCKKVFLKKKNSWKQLRWSLFLIKLQELRPVTLVKRDSTTGVFLWVFLIFQNNNFGEH